MRAEQHFAKAQRLEDARKRLNLMDDYETILWSCLHGSAHLMNAVLHVQNLAADDKDQIHSNIPEYTGGRTPELDKVIASMEYIQSLGPRYVRGIEPWQPADGEKCIAEYDNIKKIAKGLLK